MTLAGKGRSDTAPGGRARSGAPEVEESAPLRGTIAGFTLIEVVAALVIFALGVLLTTGLTTSLSIQMRHASLRSEVVAMAQQQMEALSLIPYDSLVLGSSVDTLQVQQVGFTRTLLIQIDAQNPRLREIRLTVNPLHPPGPSFRMVHFTAPH